MQNKYFILIIVIVLLGLLLMSCSKEQNKSESYDINFKQENYLNINLPILEENVENILSSYSLDNIDQYFYLKDELIYSYIKIDNIKYDLGQIDFEYKFNTNKENFYFKKTVIMLNPNVYKQTTLGGSMFNLDVYIQIVDNIPIVLCKIENGYELENNNEIMTISSTGTKPHTILYSWNDKYIGICDFNQLLNSDSVLLKKESYLLEAIKKINNESQVNNVKYYKLKDLKILSIEK